MANSSLVSYTKLSPNHSGARKYPITRITPHCVVGQLSVEAIGSCFDQESEKASCNYGIGTDGRVALIVDESYRSWCSSSKDNDNRAVTIECASDKAAPYAFNDTVYNKLVELCADICKRNNKSKLLWIEDKDTALNYQNKSDEMLLTVHRWFKNKECPGDWMMSRMSDLAAKVTAILGGTTVEPHTTEAPTVQAPSATQAEYQVKVTASVLNIRKWPGTDFPVVGYITDKGTYTIVEERNNWGKLKSGIGWIALNYTRRV